jgi:protein tyrosine/serine phosphatase
MLSKRFLFASVVPVVVASAITGGVVHKVMDPEVRHGISVVDPGVLYRSGQLPPAVLAEAIRTRGIKTVVNLTGHQDSEEAVCRQAGITYLHLPVGDCWRVCGCRAPEEQTAAPAYDLSPLAALLDDPAAQPVLIHCTGGMHRTGVIAALYRIERQGWRADDAIIEMDLYGFGSHKERYVDVLTYLRGHEREAPRLSLVARPTDVREEAPRR